MLKVEGLCKQYPAFRLKDVSFSLEPGYIMGFIGRNGAGKSTTLKCVLNVVRKDAGRVELFGEDTERAESSIRRRLSFTPGAFAYYPRERIANVAAVYRRFYPDWDEALYRRNLDRFGLSERKRMCELSQGMRVKAALLLALSHRAELFVFDEPTSGLDPVARSELADLFREIVNDGRSSILFSTQITSDLDKCADYILFIRDGEILANSAKDDLIAEHALLSGTKEQLTPALAERMISYRRHDFGFTGLIKRRELPDNTGVRCGMPNLEDIMVYYDKEARKEA